MPLSTDFSPDSNQQLKDAGLIAASAAWQVGGTNQIWDLGAAVYTPFRVICDVTAIEVDTTDELYTLLIQGSSSSTFASTIANLAALELGASAALTGGADVGSTTGKYVIRAHNDKDGTVYQYIRGYTVVAGTIATGINFDAWADYGLIP